MEVEIRSDRVIIGGYVNAVERDSRILPPTMARDASKKFVERVRAGTFRKAIQNGKPVELKFNHRKTVGTTEDGSLELDEDAIGLRARAEITDPEVMSEARSGNLRGWSFGFKTNHAEWEDAGDIQRRYLDDIELHEVSILTGCPAYVATTIELRGDDEQFVESRGTEDAAAVVDKSEDERKMQKSAADAQTQAAYRARRLKIGGINQ